MASCKDCLYYEPCSALNAEFKKHPKDFIETDLCAKQCTTFKDRSQFVELPCKVGDLIYIIKKARGLSVRGAKVNSITITESGKIQVSCYRSSFIGLWSDDAFATKEEAEAALKERDDK